MLLNGSCGQWRLCFKWNLLFRFGAKNLSTLSANTTLSQCWSNAGPLSVTLAQHQTSTSSMPRVCWAAFNPVNTKHLYNICTMNSSWSGNAYCWQRLQAATNPMFVKCWVSIACAGQYPFSPSQYFMLPVPACWR